MGSEVIPKIIREHIEQSIGKISKSCETFPGKKSIDSEV